MIAVKARIADPVAFAPFGELIASPNSLPNIDFSAALDNQRDGAKATLYTTIVEPVALPLTLEKMERHRFSSQTFLPLEASRYLVCVAPHGKDGKPDATLMQAFVVPAGVGITYRANVWHHCRGLRLALIMLVPAHGEFGSNTIPDVCTELSAECG